MEMGSALHARFVRNPSKAYQTTIHLSIFTTRNSPSAPSFKTKNVETNHFWFQKNPAEYLRIKEHLNMIGGGCFLENREQESCHDLASRNGSAEGNVQQRHVERQPSWTKSCFAEVQPEDNVLQSIVACTTTQSRGVSEMPNTTIRPLDNAAVSSGDRAYLSATEILDISSDQRACNGGIQPEDNGQDSLLVCTDTSWSDSYVSSIRSEVRMRTENGATGMTGSDVLYPSASEKLIEIYKDILDAEKRLKVKNGSGIVEGLHCFLPS